MDSRCVKVKRTDLGETEFEIRTLGVSTDGDLDGLKTALAASLGVLPEDALFKVFKLRNAEGALIPLTHIRGEEDPHGYTSTTRSNEALIQFARSSLSLEVTNCRQTVLHSDHLHNLTKYKNFLSKRVDRLEGRLPCVIKARSDEESLRQVHELSAQLSDLSGKIDSLGASCSSSALIH